MDTVAHVDEGVISPMTGKSGWPKRVGWLVAFVGAPTVALAVWRHPAFHHLAFVVVLGMAYGAVIAVTRFTGGVIGDVAVRWQKRLADGADLALQRRVSRFERDYRAFILTGLRFIDQKGLGTVGPFTPELDDVFVDVSLTPRPPHLVKEGLLPDLPIDVTERRALSEFLDHPDPAVLAVIGAPGSGKTTLLRHTARQACLPRTGKRGQKHRLPILLYLRDHAVKIAADPGVALTDLLGSTLGELRPAEPDGWFEQRLRDGDCAVLLDGLDEVARPEDRRKVAVWAERQIRQYPSNDYVITSRPHGYRAAEIDGAGVLQVRGFSTDQVRRFVHGWYLAVERHSTGAAGEDIAARARREADDLIQRLHRTPALYDLAVNPLLLTMIANVHRYRGALPGSRADLYAEICQVMLFRRQEAKNLPVQLDGDKKEALLRGLAYAMMQRRLSDLPKNAVLAEITPMLRRLPYQATVENFLADAGSNGLLIERESGSYCFAHHTFQEYLAAAHIRDKGLASVLADAVDDPWWLETTLLYTARADADAIVTACLKSGTITALTLAFDCADQGSAFAEQLRHRLEDLLAEVSNPATSQERRHLITGVLLTRHLRQQIRASDGTRICTRPITASLYLLFRDDTSTPAPDGPAAVAAGTEPISGIRASDAVAFARWVNTVTGGGAAYHLPSRAAMDDPAAQRFITSATATPAVWIESGRAAPELWVPARARRHPHQIDAATLTTHLDSDMARSLPTLTRLLLMRSAVAVSLLASYPQYTAYLDPFAAALARTLAVARDLDLAREFGLARDIGRGRNLARDLARDLELDRHTSRSRTRVLDRDLDLDLEGVRDVVRDLERTLELALELARGFEVTRALDLDVDRILDLHLHLDRDFAGASGYPSTYEVTHGRVDGRAVLLDRVLEIRCSRVMGSALSQALIKALRWTGYARDWPARFSRAFIDVVGISGLGYLVSPDALGRRLADAMDALQESQAVRGRPDEPSWGVTVGRRLQQTAVPVFNRQEQLTRSTATSVRLAALCLAVEADGIKQRKLGEAFRKIAANVTLLERRAYGDDPVTETILLAVE